MYQGHWSGGGFMWLFWVLIIVAIVWALKEGIGHVNRQQERQKSALDILKNRYARGEIDPQEFEQKRRDLEQ